MAAAAPEILSPVLLVVRVSFIMAAQAGRSVVFVTGNAKKLEEVRVKRRVFGRIFIVSVLFMAALAKYRHLAWAVI